MLFQLQCGSQAEQVPTETTNIRNFCLRQGWKDNTSAVKQQQQSYQ